MKAGRRSGGPTGSAGGRGIEGRGAIATADDDTPPGRPLGPATSMAGGGDGEEREEEEEEILPQSDDEDI